MKEVNGKAAKNGTRIPAIDEVLGDSDIDRKLRAIAEAARAAGITSLDDIPALDVHVNGTPAAAKHAPNSIPAKAPRPQNA